MIDRQTVERIKAAANIVDVVSEFVTLRKSGANFKGLCPFHNERTPSFFVSPARGTCHCFGCGKGGTPVSFIMEHEQMTYPEALRWLARKYNIEIQERELTDEERREQSERESMFIVNEWAAKYFADNLHSHPDGQAIGMQYFRSRGFRDDIIEKFQLGFSLNDRLALAKTAVKQGYKEEFLEKTGICYKNDRGQMIDRYAGRVIFPWIGVSGKVVGFGGRKLDAATKGVVQKYVNSPDSDIYHKDHELYGIFQAKRAITKEDCVYMVEGYTDVISMHQCGIENVVANSGTALSVHQIHILHRFTSNIVLLYDGDAAGIHAALRGTDMLLAEGMNLKVLLLPDGDDPDSFARKHTAEDFRNYIEAHQTDFIQFKTDLLLRNERDPLKRSEAISSIIESISMVPNPVLRDAYLHDCAQRVGIKESTLVNQLNTFVRNRRASNQQSSPLSQEPTTTSQAAANAALLRAQQADNKVESLLAKLILQRGDELLLMDVEGETEKTHDYTVAEYVKGNLQADNLTLTNPLYQRIIDEAAAESAKPDFRSEQYFLNHEDINISQLAMQLTTEHYQLQTTAQQPATEDPEEQQRQQKAQRAKLLAEVDHLLLDFRKEYVDRRLKELMDDIRQPGLDDVTKRQKLAEYQQMQTIKNAIAQQLGNNLGV